MDKIGKVLRERQSEIARAIPAVVPRAPRLDPSQVRSRAPQIQQAIQSVRPAPKPTPSRGVSMPSATVLKSAPTLNPMAALMQSRPKQEQVRSFVADRPFGGFQLQEQEPQGPQYPEDDTSWGVYQLPTGEMVAMPSAWSEGLPEGSQQHGDTLTDPAAIERARESDIAFLNQSQEVQEQIAVPGVEPTNLSTTPLWIGDDQARQQEELANQDAASRVVAAQGLKRIQKSQMTTPVSMASDQARQQEEVINQQEATEYMRNLPRLKQKQAMTTPIWIGDDQARQQEEMANQDAASRTIGEEGLRRIQKAAMTTPISIASDQARQQEELANQQLSASTYMTTKRQLLNEAGEAEEIPDDMMLVMVPSADPGDADGYEEVLMPEDSEIPAGGWLVETSSPVPGDPVADAIQNSVDAAWELIPDPVADAITGLFTNTTPTIGGLLSDALAGIEWGYDKSQLDELWDAIPDDVKITVQGAGEALLFPIKKVIEVSAWGAGKTQEAFSGLLMTALLTPEVLAKIPFAGNWADEAHTAAVFLDQYMLATDGRSLVRILEEEGPQRVFEVVYNQLVSALPGGEKGLLATAARLTMLIFTDPLTYLPIVGQFGKILKGGGLALKMMPEGTVAKRILGQVLETAGDVTYKGARVAEEAADLGAGVAMDLIAKGARRAGITQGHATAKARANRAEVERALYAQFQKQDRPPVATVGPTGVVTPPAASLPPGGSTVTPPPSTPDGSTVTPPTTPTPGGTAAGGFTPTPGGSTATPPPATVIPPGGTASPPPPDTVAPPPPGQGAVVSGPVVQFDDGPSVPVRWIPSPDPARGRRAIDMIYQKVGERRWAPVRAEMADTWNASEANLARQGRGAARTEMAIESSAVARDTIASMERHGIYDREDWAYNVASGAENPYYRAVEETIRMPWDATVAQRRFLSTQGPSGWVADGIEMKGQYAFIRTELLDDYPTARQIEQANNFVNMMEQHAYWQPDSFDNADFLMHWQKAVDLDTQLRANDLRTIVGDGIYANAGRPLADLPITKAKGIKPSPGADDPIELGTPRETPSDEVIARIQWKPNREGGQQVGNQMEVRRDRERGWKVFVRNGDEDWRDVTLAEYNQSIPGRPARYSTPEEFIQDELAKGDGQWATRVDSFDSATATAWSQADESESIPPGTGDIAVVDESGVATDDPAPTRPTPTRAPSTPIRDRWQRVTQDFEDSTELIDENGYSQEELFETYTVNGNDTLTIQAETVLYKDVPRNWQREFPGQKNRGVWWTAAYKNGAEFGTTFYAPSPARAGAMALNEARAKGIPPIPEGFSGINPADVMAQDTSDLFVVPTKMDPEVATSTNVATKGRNAKEGETQARAQLKQKIRFGSLKNIGDETEWMGIPIEKVLDEGNTVGYVAKTAGGEVGFIRETAKRGSYTNTRIFPVDAAALRTGEVRRIEMSLADQNRNGINQAQIGQVIYDRHKRGNPDATEPTTTEPEDSSTESSEPAAVDQRTVDETQPVREPDVATEPDPVPVEPEAPTELGGNGSTDGRNNTGDVAQSTPTRAPSRGPRRVIRRRDRSLSSDVPDASAGSSRLADASTDNVGGMERTDTGSVADAELEVAPEDTTQQSPRKARPTGDTFWLDPDDFTFDESQFQSRTETNQQWVDTLATVWNREAAPAINVVELEPEVYTVVSGHHRALAAQKAKAAGRADEVRIRVIQADNLEDAIAKGVEDSVNSNLPSLKPTPLDDARAIQMLQAKGQVGKNGKVGPFSKLKVDRSLQLLKLPATLQNALKRNFQQLPFDVEGNMLDQGIKDSRGMTERKGAAMARMIDEGNWTADDAEAFWLAQKGSPNSLAYVSDNDFESMIDMMIEHKGLFQTAKSKQQDLFNLMGEDAGSFDPVYQAMAELGKARRANELRRKALTTASNKTNQQRVATSLKKESAEVAKLDAQAEDALRNVIRNIDTESKRYSRTTEGQMKVKTASGEQFLMDLGGAAKIETPTTPIKGGTATADDLLGAPEKTPEQIRADELAAGQTDMFSMSEPERRAVDHTNTVGDASNGGIIAHPATMKAMVEDVDPPTTTKKDPTGKVDMDVPEVSSGLKVDSATVRRFNEPMPASRYTDALYREISADDLGYYLAPVSDATVETMGAQTYFANSPRLALGQGSNADGILLEFRPDFKVRVNTEKPTWDFSWDAGDAEFVTRLNYGSNAKHADMVEALESITMPDTTFNVKRVNKSLAKRDRTRIETDLLNRGWTSTKVDGGIKFTKPGSKGVGPTYATLPGLPWLGRKISGAIATTGGPMPLARTNVVSIDTSTMYWAVGRKDVGGDEFAVLSRHPFTNGDTILDRIDGHYRDIRSKRKVSHEDALLEAAEKTLREYDEHLTTNVFPAGVIGQKIKATIRKPVPARIAYDAVEKVLKTIIKGLDKTQEYYRQRMLYSHLKGPAYVLTQALGNTSTLALSGDFEAMWRYWNLKDGWWGSRKTMMDAMDRSAKLRNPKITDLERAKIRFAKDPAISSSAKLQAGLGTRRGRHELEVYQGHTDGINDDLIVTQALRSVNRHLGGLGKLSGSKKWAQWGALWDGTMRDVKSYTHTIREMREVIPDYRNQTINRMVDWGVSKQDAIDAWDNFVAGGNGVWDMDAVIDHFTPVVGDGRARSLGRDWQGVVNQTEKKVDAALRKYTFAGDETRADLVLKRAFLFHHFMSRQSWFLLSQAAHHPFLINLYMNMQEELEKLSEGWPPYMQNWVKFIGFGGMALFLNPVSLAATFITFADQGQTWMPEQVTQVGEYIMQMQEYIGINPLITNGLNLLGAMGDGPVPDPFLIWREDRAVTAAINWARYFGFGSDRSPIASQYDQFMADARETLSDWNPFIDEAVEARSMQADVDRDIRILMIDEAQREGLDPKDPAVQEAMMDPESELYQEAVKRYLLGESAAIATDTVLGPFRPRVVQTNEEGKPIYSSLSRDLKDLANTTDPRAAVLKGQQDRYYEIGTEQDQSIAQVWNDVAYGTVQYPVTVNGVTYSVEEQKAMSQEERIGLANALLQDYGYLEEYNDFRKERDTFLQDPENKEYAQFDTWQGDVRDYQGKEGDEAVLAYWDEITDPSSDSYNPNAAQYYETIVATGRPSERVKNLTSMGAFMAIKGIPYNAFEPIPTVTGIYTGGVGDPVNVANQNPQPQEAKPNEFEEEARTAPEYLTEMQEWDAAVAEKQAEMGYGTGPFNDLAYEQRLAVEESLEEEGTYEPGDPPFAVEKYIEWAEQQPRGADTSIDAFLVYNRKAGNAGAIARFEEMLEAPPPVSTSDTEFWGQIFELINEHDHTRYP